MFLIFIANKLKRWSHLFQANSVLSSADLDEEESNRNNEYLLDLEELLFSWVKRNSSKSVIEIKRNSSKSVIENKTNRISKTNDLWKSFSGNGIVMCVNDKYAVMAYTTIEMIRKVHNSMLPIEIFYMNNRDLSEDNQRMLNLLPKVKTINLDNVFDLETIRVWGWSAKAFALLASSFQNSMLIDADVIFLQNPEKFFQSNLFIKHRALFFQDRTIPMTDKSLYLSNLAFLDSLFPKKPYLMENRYYNGKSQHQQESGVVLIDKRARFTGLMASCILNSGDIRTESYRHMHGDKETFWLGFEIADQDYAFNPYAPGAVGKIPKKNGQALCSVQLFHTDEHYQPAWINGGILENKMIDNHSIAAFESWMIEPGKWYPTSNFTLCLEPKSKNSLHEFTKEETALISASISTYTQALNDLKHFERTMPSRISPWSYDSKSCSQKTFDSQFSHWFKEKNWGKYNDYGYGQYKRELEFYIKNYRKPSVHNYGRGIIYSCHPRLVQITMVSISLLRHHGCNLPIEIW